jgi:intracellular septation protein A
MTAMVFDVGAQASTRTTLIAVAKHSLPSIIEASLIPSALFYVSWLTVGHTTAYAAALLWAFAVLVCRRHRGERIPGILVLALIGLTIRTILALCTGSAFLYFAQPILATGLFAAVFLISALAGRPFVARIAGDFYPMTAAVAQGQRVRRLFHRLTLLWAGVQLLNAAVSASLLLTLEPATFVAIKTGVVLAITTMGVVLTVVWSLRVARHEGLVATS